MRYLIVTRFEKNGKWSEITREFDDYEMALSYAKYEYSREADNISVCLYELKEYWN